jgi:hypothetical protein
MEPGHKWDESELYAGDIDERPAPPRRNPWLLLIVAFLLSAGWGAWLMHKRGVARRAAALAALEARASGAPGAAGASDGAAAVLAPDPEARPALVPSSPPANQRRFYGVVFDLATKKPVSGALISLSVGEQRSVVNTQSCQASLNGHYLCDVSSHFDGLWVQVSSQGYTGQFEDFYPSLLKKSDEQRRTVLAQRDGYLEPARVTFVASQELVRLDLAAVPADWAAAAQRKR